MIYLKKQKKKHNENLRLSKFENNKQKESNSKRLYEADVVETASWKFCKNEENSYAKLSLPGNTVVAF